MSMQKWNTVAACVAAAALTTSAFGQVAPVQSELYVSGLARPLEMVQHPNNPNVQFVVQQGGVIRIIENGVLGGTFLNISSLIVDSSGERGLLGLDFDPNYGVAGAGACSDCLYVSHTNSSGNSVVARYRHASGNPLSVDTSTREVLFTINQPFSNHNGGHIEFGPDGMLYIAMGDGGFANDPFQNAQNTSNPLGAILRIDVSSPPGFTNPAGNPFLGVAGDDRIWSYGLRNPWKFTFDAGPCSTGAMLIADVGQDAREEINYEPANTPGLNYGWDCMEGTLCLGGSTGCSCSDPDLVDPIFELSHPTAQSITGGYVYRGAGMPSNRGRYFFGDFVTGRVWSLGLEIDQDGEATVVDTVEHTQELSGGSGFWFNISSFATDAQGELYALNWSGGQIHRIRGVNQSADINLDGEVNGADLAVLLAQWQDAGCGVADLNNDGIVDGADLAILLSQWGS